MLKKEREKQIGARMIRWDLDGKNADVDNHIVYSAEDLLEIEDDPSKWIVENVIPKSSRVIAFGKESQFKSTVMFDLCVSVASGTLLCGQFRISTPGPVLLNSVESSIMENKDRIMAHARSHCVNPAKMPLHFCQQPFMFDDPLHMARLEYTIQTIRPVMVVIDPLDSFFEGDENSSSETKRVRSQINYLINKYSTTFIIIHHEGKDKSQTMRGSSAWSGWCDTSLRFTRHKKSLLNKVNKQFEYVSIEAKKQRSYRPGHVFSAIVIYDEILKECYFFFYNGKNEDDVYFQYLKRECYGILRDNDHPMLIKELMTKTGARHEMISSVLKSLENDNLTAKGVLITEDNKKRQGWTARKSMNIVDKALVLTRYNKKIFAEDEEDPTIEILDDILFA